jgi:hypothetical protein
VRVQNEVTVLWQYQRGALWTWLPSGSILAGNLFSCMSYPLSMNTLCLIVLLLSVEQLQLAFLFLSILGGIWHYYILCSVVVSLDSELSTIPNKTCFGNGSASIHSWQDGCFQWIRQNRCLTNSSSERMETNPVSEMCYILNTRWWTESRNPVMLSPCFSSCR